MLNQAAVMLSKDKSEDKIQKLPHAKLEPKHSKASKDNKKIKSPKVNKRALPDAPAFLKGSNASKEILSKSSDDLLGVSDAKKEEDHNISIMNKYKYNSLPRKKDKQARTMSTSTFYINTDLTSSTDGSKATSSNSNSRNSSPLLLKKKLSVNSTESDKRDSTGMNYNNLVVNTEKQTHVALYKFYARHKDEIAFCEGDPIQVLKCFDDLWYEGVNLSTGKQGLFPSRYVADILSNEFVVSPEDDHEHRQFHMRFLGSVEVNNHKGDEILCFAIAKVVNQRSMLSTSNPPSCVLQVSPRGIRICDLDDNVSQPNQEVDRKPKKGRPVEKNANEESCVAHFFSLKNVTYCGNHPKDRRYFGFITKHPDEHRFACHIFMSKYSTDNVARIVGDCFQKFYANYLEYRAPTEDLYIE